MSMLSNIASQYAMPFCFMILSLIAVNPRAYSTDLSDADLERRVENLSSTISMRYTRDVQKHIRNYTKYNKKGTEYILGRVSVYFPMFENILRDNNIPDDLKYLAVIESGLSPSATSKVGAAGLWQFMKPTGRMMGLKVNSTIDERRDPVKSTEAAAKYLAYLYERFDDWTLAIAAYNCGPGNVRKAIKRSGGKKDFWEIVKYLPKETRNYVPKLIAVNYLMNYYYDHDISPRLPEDKLLRTSTAQVYEKVSLRDISKRYDLSLQLVKKLNPSYIRNYIPANADGTYQLTLPTDEMIRFVNEHQTATLLARPYTLKKEIRDTKEVPEAIAVPEARPIINVTEIRSSLVSFKIKSDGLYSDDEIQPSVIEEKLYKYTRLRVRESIQDVARRTGISSDQILWLNGYDDTNRPTVGSKIKLYKL